MSAELDAAYKEVLSKLPDATAQPRDCTHPQFAAVVAVARLEDAGIFSAEIRVVCVACWEPFRFKGVPAGWSPTAPCVSIDGLELYAPIEPELEKQLQAGATYTVPSIPVRQ